LAYQLYQDDLLLCETSDPTARELTCPTVLDGRSVFSMVTVYGDDGAAVPTGDTSETSTELDSGETTTGSSDPTTTEPGSGDTTTGSTTDPDINGNQVPVAYDITLSVEEDGSVHGKLSGSDADGDALTYNILHAPAIGAVELLNSATGEFRYQPNRDLTGGDSFSYAVSDGKDISNSAAVTVAILPVNDPPVANAGPDQVVSEGALVTLDATNSYDIDDESLSVSWVQLDGPTVSLSDPDALQPRFSAVDIGSDSATLTFQLKVADAQGLEDTDVSTVNIVWMNNPPVAAAGEDQNVFVGDTVVLDASRSMDDDGIASYAWVQLSGPEMLLSDSTAMSPSFDVPDLGPSGASIIFELTVTDFGGLYTRDTLVINAFWENTPPVADAGVDQSVSAGDAVTLDGSLSHDVDDGIATVQWLQKTGVPVTFSDPVVLQPAFVAPADILEPQTLGFELRVTDYRGLQHTDSCIVEVLPRNNVVRRGWATK
jgi:hypothetical protein